MNNPVAWCLSYLFNKYFSDFLESLSHEQILISLLKGDILLESLVINPQEIKNSSVKLVQGLIKSFKLSIPWQKVLLGESCIIKLTISGLYLEFSKSDQVSEFSEDPSELKSKILEDYESKMKIKRNNFKKILEMLSTKFLNLEVVEFILSRLEISLSNIEINYTTNQNKDILFCVSNLKVQPTDQNFQPFPEEVTSIWNKIQSIGSMSFSSPSVTLSDSLIQFKVITLSDTSISLKSNENLEKILELNQFSVFYSSKNYLWLGQSLENTDIDIKCDLKELNLYANGDMISNLFKIFEITRKKEQKNPKEL